MPTDLEGESGCLQRQHKPYCVSDINISKRIHTALRSSTTFDKMSTECIMAYCMLHISISFYMINCGLMRPYVFCRS